jgi:uncharacterized protein (DUF2336 family)
MDKHRQDALTRLSRETSAPKRRALIEELALVFREPPPSGQRELQEVGEALARLVPNFALPERVIFAERLATAREAPTYLVRLLALDEPEVAGPVLAKSPVFLDADLLAFVQRGGSERLTAIARRSALSKQLQAALIASADPKVVLALLTNRTLTLSSAALASTLALARKDEAIAEIVIERTDMPIGPLAELFFILTTKARLKLLRALGERGELAPHVEEPTQEALAEFLEFVRAGDRERLLALLSRDFHLPRDIAERVLGDETGEAFAVVALGARLTRAAYSTFIVLSHSGEGTNSALTLYDRMPLSGARRLLAQWQHGAAQRGVPHTELRPLTAAPPDAGGEGPDPRRPRFPGLRRANPGKR